MIIIIFFIKVGLLQVEKVSAIVFFKWSGV